MLIENSFRNFHAKGLDYLCLERTASHTLKAYFFDGFDVRKNTVVFPHDHRYDFLTRVVAGDLLDIRYVEDPRGGMVHQRFTWDTPLTGGFGFVHDTEVTLRETERNLRTKGQALASNADYIHTIQVQSDTVLILHQFRDYRERTKTYAPGASLEPPNLDGLYDPMSEDHFLKRLEQLECLCPVSYASSLQRARSSL